MDTLTVTPIEDNNNLLNTINSHIKLRKLKEKHLEVREADASKQVSTNIREEGNKNYSSLYYSNKLEAQLRKASKEEELAKIKKEKREKEAWEREAELDSLLDSDDYCLDSSLDINSKDNLEDEEATILTTVYSANKQTRIRDSLSARDTFTLRTRRKCEMPKQKGLILQRRTSTSSYNNDYDSSLENIGRLTKEEAIEMRINTTDAISKALAAANKLVALQSYVLGGGQTVFDEFHNCKLESTIIANLLRNIITNIKHDASEHELSYNIVQNAEQQYRDILEKEGLNELEASRRVIFNRFEMQAIASYSALATLKAAQFKTYGSCKVKRFTLNSVKDLFTNLSKDYFLSIAAEDVAKAANTLLLLKEVCAKILIGSYKLIVQAIIVALIAFAEAIILTEATHVVIIEPQDRQNIQD
ncbi:hypothetical protein HBH95_174860 [Parastagonospora nodorum]|nr:hypothetical protein HBH95_174860 [Parastagonospora nodorum]